MVANSGILSSLSATPTSQLIDKIDSPHSGLFKGLHSMAQGNYALKDGATLGFAHTFTTSGANIQVALTAGKGFSNGQYIAVDALSATTINKPSSGALYHWVAFADDGDGTGTISVIMGSSDGVVPDLTVTLTPISLIKVQSTDTHSTVAFQTFTTSKTENKLSIGYENSNTYTEAGSISGTSSGLFITGIGTASVATDDKVLIQDTGSSDVIKSVTVSSIVALAGGASLANDGNNRITTATGAGGINGEANLTFDGSLLSLTSAATTTDVFDITADGVTTAKVIDITADGLTTGSALNIISDSSSTSTRNVVYIKNDHASAVNATTLKVESDSTNGSTDASTAPVLHVKGATAGPLVTIESTQASSDEAPELQLYRSQGSGGSGVGVNSDDIGTIRFVGQDGAGNDFEYAHIFADAHIVTNGSEKGRMLFRTRSAGTYMNNIQLETDQTIFNASNQDINFRVDGDNIDYLLQIDAGDDRIGINTSAPQNILQINVTGGDSFDGIQVVREDSNTAAGEILGGIGFDSTDGNVPSSITEASAFIAAYATEAHSTTAKGGEIKMGITLAGTADDQPSTTLSRIGYPTAGTATVYAGAFSRAAVATVGAVTYSPTIADSGTVIIMTNASSIVTLPDVSATEIGVQFTIINNSGGTLTGKIVSADTTNTRFNGAGSYAAQDIEDDKAKTFICWAADNWQVIG
ncbi:MAG: hypothetical protein GOVbin1782_109 [Prokaryotic dsDNA virus sp.]|mgnify:CR=1 FL=1|nr:MAG: hypothetical protein GOVbin1782_109 [Prokaryotic dsDNA virus sp.]|tara:strand:+ start:6772 stop:8865 length:2094 start_codon:yes stop_codon:yes gene_type:complete